MERSFGFGLSGLIARVGRGSLGAIVALVSVMGLCGVAEGQCQPGWQLSDGIPGTDGTVYSSVMWDPDGPGPQHALLVIGGNFYQVGNVATGCVATYDPETGVWKRLGNLAPRLGSQIDSRSGALALGISPTGDLVAGGEFASDTSITPRYLVRWDGTNWSSVAGEPRGVVNALLTLSNGDVAVGGSFMQVGDNIESVNIARWTPTSWLSLNRSTFDLPSFIRSVRAIAELPDGRLVVGGQEPFVGPGFIARQNGTGWSSLASGPTIYALGVLSNGDLVAAGSNFTVSESTSRSTTDLIARFDGTTWRRFGASSNALITNPVTASSLQTLLVLPNDELVVGGVWELASDPQRVRRGVARWNGQEWTAVGETFSVIVLGSETNARRVYALTRLSNGDIFAGGRFGFADDIPVYGIARFDGQSWNRMARGFSGPRQPANTGSPFQEMPSRAGVSDTDRLADGRFVAAGLFSYAGRSPARNIAVMENGEWQQLGAGVDGRVFQIAALSDNSLAVTFSEQSTSLYGSMVQRWSAGAGFETIGTLEKDDQPGVAYAVLALPSAEFLVVGSFTGVSGVEALNIARWSRGVWSPVGAGLNGTVTAATLTPTGEIIAGGEFRSSGDIPINRIARWNGDTWSAIGDGLPGPVNSVAAGNDGQIYASYLAAGQPVTTFVWDGSAWNAGTGELAGFVRGFTNSPDGTVYCIRQGATRVPPSPSSVFRLQLVRISGNEIQNLGALGFDNSSYFERPRALSSTQLIVAAIGTIPSPRSDVDGRIAI